MHKNSANKKQKSMISSPNRSGKSTPSVKRSSTMLNPRILSFAEEMKTKAAEPRGLELKDITKIVETNEEDQSLTTTLDKNRAKNESGHTDEIMKMKPASN